jgi:rare lipoprotein A
MKRLILLLFVELFVSGCASISSSPPASLPSTPQTMPKERLPGVDSAVPPATPRKPGGYYLDDGPMDTTPQDLMLIPDAIPKREPYASGANRPYQVLGETYFPDLSELPFSERGIATWYGRKFHGKPTSSGEAYDMFAMTAAHKTLPIPSYARVTYIQTGQSVVVRINDRGPFFPGRVIDLSYTAATKLGLAAKGSGEVLVERVFPAGPLVEAASPRPREPSASPKSVSGVGAYYLQVGAFADATNAERVLSNTRVSLGEWANKVALESDGRIHRIKVGPLASENIDAVSAMIEKSLNIKPRIIGP